jgi:hypothetical protein
MRALGVVAPEAAKDLASIGSDAFASLSLKLTTYASSRQALQEVASEMLADLQAPTVDALNRFLSLSDGRKSHLGAVDASGSVHLFPYGVLGGLGFKVSS